MHPLPLPVSCRSANGCPCAAAHRQVLPPSRALQLPALPPPHARPFAAPAAPASGRAPTPDSDVVVLDEPEEAGPPRQGAGAAPAPGAGPAAPAGVGAAWQRAQAALGEEEELAIVGVAGVVSSPGPARSTVGVRCA
jgi:hypothetical protein